MSTKQPVNIESLDKDAFHEWVNSFDVVLSDCDGNKILDKINAVFGQKQDKR